MDAPPVYVADGVKRENAQVEPPPKYPKKKKLQRGPKQPTKENIKVAATIALLAFLFMIVVVHPITTFYNLRTTYGPEYTKIYRDHGIRGLFKMGNPPIKMKRVYGSNYAEIYKQHGLEGLLERGRPLMPAKMCRSRANVGHPVWNGILATSYPCRRQPKHCIKKGDTGDLLTDVLNGDCL